MGRHSRSARDLPAADDRADEPGLQPDHPRPADDRRGAERNEGTEYRRGNQANQARYAALKSEHASGQQMLAELKQKQRALRHTLLRISGAIQVLEEELGQAAAQPAEVAANGAGYNPEQSN
jgi:uncharacterized protein (DUF3084 family)